MFHFPNKRRYVAAAIALAASSIGLAAPAQAGVIYTLQATNIQYFIPSSLFTSNTVSGYIEIADSVAPGGSFGIPQLQALSFNVAGFKYTLADFLPGFDVDGRISADGKSVSFLSSGYDLSTSVPGCDEGCFGSLDIAQSQPSNLIAFNDGNIGAIQFDTAFIRAAVPEPLTLSLFGAGLVGAAAMRRRKAKKA